MWALWTFQYILSGSALKLTRKALAQSCVLKLTKIKLVHISCWISFANRPKEYRILTYYSFMNYIYIGLPYNSVGTLRFTISTETKTPVKSRF